MTCSLDGTKNCRVDNTKKEIRFSSQGIPDMPALRKLVKKTFSLVFANFTLTPAGNGLISPKGQSTDWILTIS
jgi:hypothetical protein